MTLLEPVQLYANLLGHDHELEQGKTLPKVIEQKQRERKQWIKRETAYQPKKKSIPTQGKNGKQSVPRAKRETKTNTT